MVSFKKKFPREFLQNCLSSDDTYFSKEKTIASKLILFAVVLLIIVWQLHFYVQPTVNTSTEQGASFNKKDFFSSLNITTLLKKSFSYVDDKQHITAASGGSGNESVYAYGLYYWGLFPVYPAREFLPKEFLNDAFFYSKKGADLIMEKYPKVLWMECWGSIANGDFGRHYLLYLHSLFKKSPCGVSYIFTNALFFIIALVALFFVTWYYKRGLLGFLLVFFVGSYSFQRYEVYSNNNIFGYFITIALLITAMLFPMILNIPIKKWQQIALFFLSGILLATFNYIRPEGIFMVFSMIFVLLFYKWSDLMWKIALIFLFLLSFIWTGKFYHNYFDQKFNQAYSIVAKKGGNVFDGRRVEHHPLWHPLWCGLGDFDNKYNYKWHDDAPRLFAKSVLEKKYGVEILKSTEPTPRSNKAFYVLPQYEATLRDQIIKNIINDPVWYLTILFKRVLAIAVFVAADKVQCLGFTVRFIYLSIPCCLFLGVLFSLKKWEYIKLLIVSFPTAFLSLFVYSGGGTPLYFIGHLYCLAITVYGILKLVPGTRKQFLSMNKTLPQ